MTLYAASVPVFLHYLGRAKAMVAQGQGLEARLADAFPAGQQFGTAAGYALRVAYPLAGRAVPAPLTDAAFERIEMAIAALGRLDAAEFAGAAERVIAHRAGTADLRQTGADFLFLYGLPNFFFHLTMGYASLRSAGVPLGKADFDAMHSYPADFRFS